MVLFDLPKNSRRRRQLIAAVTAFVAMSTAAFPGSADLKQDLQKLREQQAQVQASKAAKAQEVDATTSKATDLTSALRSLNAKVNATQARVSDAEARLKAAETRHDSAVQAVVDQQAAITKLESAVSNSAIQSFVSQDPPHSPLFEDADPVKAVRVQNFAELVTSDGVTTSDQLKAAKEDLVIEQANAVKAQGEAEGIRNELSGELATLQSQQNEQQDLVDRAEAELDQKLSEAAALADLDKQLADQIVATTAELARQQALAAARRRSNPAAGNTLPGFPSPADVVNVRGIWIHKSIAGNLEALLKAAAADGINLGGGGYRNSAAQVALRQAHCGSSSYAIYQMPASACSPPTARPGASMHEQGLAVDFTYEGSVIAGHGNAGWQWLNAHAGKYGLYNLPSEPWHWSTNGN